MSLRLSVPQNLSYAEQLEDGRYFAASAERNAVPISRVIDHYAPDHGVALEIASGTGQHVAQFAALRPKLIWQPTDANTARLPGIDAWIDQSGHKNIRPARELDATRWGWSRNHGDNALVLIVNLLHLVSVTEAQTVLSEAAASLAPGGVLILYGPFLRDQKAISQEDWEFDATLRETDPEIGYKDDLTVIQWLNNHGLLVETPISMPANNLTFVATHTGAPD